MSQNLMRVLIAEDEDIIRKGLVYTIDWLGMNCVVVAEAANGREGLEKILEYKPDVVLADICMPFLDGIEMIKKASETVRFQSVLLTSYADFEYARRAIDARVLPGAAGHSHAGHEAVPDQRDLRRHRIFRL